MLCVQWFYLIRCSVTVSTHDCWIGCTTAVLCRAVAVRTPFCLKGFLIPDGIAVLCKHMVYTSFCCRKKLRCGQVRNAVFTISDAWHTAFCGLAKFCLSVWLQHCVLLAPSLLCRQNVSFMRLVCFVRVTVEHLLIQWALNLIVRFQVGYSKHGSTMAPNSPPRVCRPSRKGKLKT